MRDDPELAERVAAGGLSANAAAINPADIVGVVNEAAAPDLATVASRSNFQIFSFNVMCIILGWPLGALSTGCRGIT
jgi:hypothetical protein